jgi:hypothetical protein
MNILCIEFFCSQKSTKELCSSVAYPSSTVTVLTTETSLWTCACTSGWAVLLPSDTHKKPVTSITAVSLAFVTYLLTFCRKERKGGVAVDNIISPPTYNLGLEGVWKSDGTEHGTWRLQGSQSECYLEERLYSRWYHSLSEGSAFTSRPGNVLSRLRLFIVFFSPSPRQTPYSTLN